MVMNFKLFLENEKNDLEDCIKSKLLQEPILNSIVNAFLKLNIEYVYFSLYNKDLDDITGFLKGIYKNINIKDKLVNIIKTISLDSFVGILREVDRNTITDDNFGGLFRCLVNLNDAILSFNAVYLNHLVFYEHFEMFLFYERKIGTSFIDCFKPFIITEEEKSCCTYMIMSNIDNFIKEHEDEINYAIKKWSNARTKFYKIYGLQEIANILDGQYVFKKYLINIIEKSDRAANLLFDFSLLPLIKACLGEGDNEIDWRPQETLPEDYYTL